VWRNYQRQQVPSARASRSACEIIRKNFIANLLDNAQQQIPSGILLSRGPFQA
jgi:hypothetical protein